MKSGFICRSCLARLRQTGPLSPRRDAPLRLLSSQPAPSAGSQTEDSTFEQSTHSQPRSTNMTPTFKTRLRSLQWPRAGLPPLGHTPQPRRSMAFSTTQAPRHDDGSDKSPAELRLIEASERFPPRRRPRASSATRASRDDADWNKYWTELGLIEESKEESKTRTRPGKIGNRQKRPRAPYDEGVRRLDEAEIKQYHNWKNKVRDTLLNDVRKDGWKPVPGRQIRVAKQLLGHDTVEVMSAVWASMDLSRRKRIWPNVMSSALVASPEKALLVLQATLEPLPPGYALQDVAWFLALWQRSLPPHEAAAHAEELIDTVMGIVKSFSDQSDGRIVFRQNALHHLISSINATKADEFYTCLSSHGHTLHPNTLLHFADRFSKDKVHQHAALKIACGVAAAGGADLNSTPWASLCTSIISNQLEGGDAEGGDNEAMAPLIDTFEQLLQHGLAPNVIHFTAVIRTLASEGHMSTAWNVVEIMHSHEIKPDPVLISTLLEGAKESSQPIKDIEMALDMAIEHNAFDVPLWNSMLSCVSDMADKLAKEQTEQITPRPYSVPAFWPMLHFYAKIFHLEPLQHLIPVDLAAQAKAPPEMPAHWEQTCLLFPALESASATVTDKLHPTGTTLAIMFSSYVRSLSQATSVLSLYSYLRRLIQSGNPVCGKFMADKGSFLHDVIIRRLCEYPGLLRAALDVAGDMLKDSDTKSKQLNAATAADPWEDNKKDVNQKKRKLSHPTPSLYTWNILIQGFMSQSEIASGERIVSMMKEHRIQPTLVTWNIILNGYARANNMDKTIATLRHIEEEGLQANERTMQAFARLATKEEALREMEDSLSRDQEDLESFPDDYDEPVLEAAASM